MAQRIIDAEPSELAFDTLSTALVVIGRQRDLVAPGGIFGGVSDSRRTLAAPGA